MVHERLDESTGKKIRKDRKTWQAEESRESRGNMVLISHDGSTVTGIGKFDVNAMINFSWP